MIRPGIEAEPPQFETRPFELADPRLGDIEDDATSTKDRSLLAIAGTMLVEVSLPKLLFAWVTLLLVPALALGVAPLALALWLMTVTGHVLQIAEWGAAIFVVMALLAGWFAWRPLFNLAEASFWSLNAIAVQPVYIFCREAIRHVAQRATPGASASRKTLLATLSAASAGAIICALALLVVAFAWPYSRWVAEMRDLAAPANLIVPGIANAIIIMAIYLAVAALIWGLADATMDQPIDFHAFDAPAPGEATWRVVHLSDIHIVGERYGFRLECGRKGPRGNERLRQVFERIAAIHAADPIDLILISGDMTDAGRAAEWAEFLDIVEQWPALAGLILALPGNHDLNIVDRANPARFDLSFSTGKRLRQMRALSAMASVQAGRVRVCRNGDGAPAATLAQTLEPYIPAIAAFADKGGIGRAMRLASVFDNQFPMILPPKTEQGLGVVLLNSNAPAHFSFTNALGMVSASQGRRLLAALRAWPQARWIVALHHHLVEYPMPVAFSERIGTALINGSWFVRLLKRHAERIVVMHGHRHIDWIGTCGPLRIISAPSPVMEARDADPTHFYIHSLAAGDGKALRLFAPEKVEIKPSVPQALT